MIPIVYKGGIIRPALEEDATKLAPHLRQADLDEIKASSGRSPEGALLFGIRYSKRAYTAVSHSGDIIAIFGVGSGATEGRGIVWLLGSDIINEVAYEFLRNSKAWIQRLYGDDYTQLWNVVDTRNTVHIRWLRWLGFKFINKHNGIGRNKEDFLEFIKDKDV